VVRDNLDQVCQFITKVDENMGLENMIMDASHHVTESMRTSSYELAGSLADSRLKNMGEI
jgi:hypothetical protein